jgi:putative flippase GtrA
VKNIQTRVFFRFLSVGIANTLVSLSVIYFLKLVLQTDDVIANVFGYSVGISVSFALNSNWTFDYRGPRFPALVKFLLVALVAYCMNLIVVIVAIDYVGFNGYVAQALGIPPYTLTSYLASKYLVFGDRRDSLPRG